MAKLTFDIESKSYDEVDVGDKTYKLFYDDESMERYEKQARKYSKQAESFANKDVEKMTEKEREQLKQESNVFVKDFLETFFGTGTFEDIYEACGRSSFNLIHVVNQIMDWMQTKTSNIDNANKYKTKRKK